mmetsp:Transcript_43741/g.125144  ORF Transcript_43741/g.125144 Transcript_43741/m.125144 type:complete len:414 (-) Transcript_43741:97-1338(-)
MRLRSRSGDGLSGHSLTVPHVARPTSVTGAVGAVVGGSLPDASIAPAPPQRRLLNKLSEAQRHRAGAAALRLRARGEPRLGGRDRGRAPVPTGLHGRPLAQGRRRGQDPCEQRSGEEEGHGHAPGSAADGLDRALRGDAHDPPLHLSAGNRDGHLGIVAPIRRQLRRLDPDAEDDGALVLGRGLAIASASAARRARGGGGGARAVRLVARDDEPHLILILVHVFVLRRGGRSGRDRPIGRSSGRGGRNGRSGGGRSELGEVAHGPPLVDLVAHHPRRVAARHRATVLVGCGAVRGLGNARRRFGWHLPELHGNGLWNDVHHREVVHANGLSTRRGVVNDTRPPAICSCSIQPQHVIRAPVAHYRSHARGEGPGQLGHAAVVVHLRREGAVAPVLSEDHLHGSHNPSAIHRERC